MWRIDSDNSDTRSLVQRLTVMGHRLGGLSADVFKPVGNLMIESIQKNIDVGGRPEFISSRAAMNEGRKTLIKTGALRNSGAITSLSKDGVEVTWGLGLGKIPMYLQMGTSDYIPSKKQRAFFWWKYKTTERWFWKAMALSKILKGLPQRPFVMFQEEDKEKILDYLNKYYIGEPIRGTA